MKSHKSGFTLLELAVVVIIIGLLISASIGGNKLILLGKLKSAREATKGAPIHAIDDGDNSLVAWFETSLKDSVTKDANGAVSKWHNRAINNKKHATQTTGAAQPIFTKYAINGVPALKFDGTDDSFTIAPVLRANDDDHTIITVWQAYDMSTSFVWSQGGVGTTTGQSTGMVRYSGTDGAGWDGYSMGYITQPYTIGNPSITAIVVNDTNSSVSYNGYKTTHTIAASTLNITTDASKIGQYTSGAHPFNGYIAEIIIFNKPLSDEEVEKINVYLASKYQIEIN